MTSSTAGHTAMPPKVAKGRERQWLKCRTCGCVSYYDYQPFSLSNPVMTTRCGHGVGASDLGCDRIDEKSARAAIAAAKGGAR